MADETTAGPASAGLCPRCESPDPAKHPAMQADGGEVQMCPHAFHYPPSPELDRQKAIIDSGDNDTISSFLDWLGENGFILARWNEPMDELYHIHVSPEELLARYFGIDRAKIEAERRALLEHIRAVQQ